MQNAIAKRDESEDPNLSLSLNRVDRDTQDAMIIEVINIIE